MEDFVEWLAERPTTSGRIVHRERRPGSDASYADLDVADRVERALDARGIDDLYAHQVAAIEAVRDGSNVVVPTPTASGKSLVYTIPAVERALDRGARTLYVAPMRALINDQEDALADFVDDLGFGPRVEVAQYTGQQSQHEKRAIRDAEPHVLLTTPDMLHYGILPHAHRLWEWFVESLELVVIDEVHEYRGVFGSHVALVLRRLARICERFGAGVERSSTARRTSSDGDPQYVCCSATIGNPVEHASAVTGRPEDSFALVDEDASASGPSHWLFWNPPRKGVSTDGGTQVDAGDVETPAAGGERQSPHPETMRLFCDLLQRGHQTLVFTGSRQTAERYAMRASERLAKHGESDLADAVAAYQAALGTDRREEIEAGLRSGDLRGVWSTSALELGIDVGSLDAVLLDGYPGTRMASHQRAGRAGRGTDPSLVGLIAGRDQLDQYLMASPEDFFEEPPEKAMVNPENEHILPDHVRCAARENWLQADDDAHFGETFPDVVSDLEDAGELERRDTHRGTRWTYDGEGSPHQSLSLRSIDDRDIRLIDVGRDEQIATLSFGDALRDAHPDAVYYHQGRTYEVKALELDRGRSLLRETGATHYTSALREKRVSVEEDLESTSLDAHPELSVHLADVRVRSRIDGYVRYEDGDDEGTRVEFDQPLPETSIRTRSLYFAIPPDVERSITSLAGSGEAYAGALHAAEHGAISLMPLELLCDRRDVGGLSTPLHPHTGLATIFVHDGHPGGVGLARGAYESIESLLAETRDMIAGCPCEDGCPACVQSPHCGNANSPLSPDLAVALLEAVTGEASSATR